jgi:hypothetical protein
MNNYTGEYLLRFLIEPIMVVVKLYNKFQHSYVTLEYDQPTGKAMISTGWNDIVQTHDIKVDDICVFSFMH